MFGLVLAGEAVYALPFHIARFFRPAVLETFGLGNMELGTAQALYGVAAMLSYFPGGLLADRFSARKLMAFSLWATAAGGLYLATLPGYFGSLVVWSFFGFSTVMLFWAALIRATREWGGPDEQGRAFGLLDGGRGLLAAVWASLAALAFGWLLPEGGAVSGMDQKREALRLVILAYTLLTFTSGLFVWFVLKGDRAGNHAGMAHWRPDREDLRHHVGRALRLPAVWFITLVVVCAYVSMKGFDNYALYAVDGFGLSGVEAAQIAALGAWTRPLAALGAGLLGDRFTVSRMTVLSFALLLGSQLLFAILTPGPDIVWVLTVNVLIGSSATFALRSLYYALMEESHIPPELTGTAVGVISVIGYTPDVFVSYTGGVLLDRSPGLVGHQHYFSFLAGFAALGLVVSLAQSIRLKRQIHTE
jgi:nitrate/nitrite transporter NarK